MAEASPKVQPEEDTPKAVKDKNCPYCGQAFTSSSLGRHLDLYIKGPNPKRHDGVHNVEEIRRLRGGITRRNLKCSKRRGLATPSGTPSAVNQPDAVSERFSNAPSPAARDTARFPVSTSAADIASKFSIGGVRWEATGVMNEVLFAPPNGARGTGAGAGDGSLATGGSDTRNINPNCYPMPPRVDRHAPQAQSDFKQKLQGALDDARAAELALREFVNAWRAAKQQIEMGSMPFDFDPLTMNFPALTLRCLRAQPTLFASTQLPTLASWSTAPPGASQFEALKSFFQEEFRKWRVKCAVATTAQFDDIRYPPSPQFQLIDRRAAIERAELAANALEQEASKHLEAAFHAWDELSDERKNELWVLELARGIATKQTEIDKLQEEQSSLRQEASNLKSQIEQLNCLQQPREFRLVPPAHIPMNEKILFELQDAAVSQGSRAVGLNLNDRHSDLSEIVTAIIGRWKNVIVSSRASSTGMTAQTPIDTPAAPSMPAASRPPVAFSSSALSTEANHPCTHNASIMSPPVTVAARTPRLINPAMRSGEQNQQIPRETARTQPTLGSALAMSTTTSNVPQKPPNRSTLPSSKVLASGLPAPVRHPDVELVDSLTKNNDGDEDECDVDNEDNESEIEEGDEEVTEIGDDAAPTDIPVEVLTVEPVVSGASAKAVADAKDDDSSEKDDDDDDDDDDKGGEEAGEKDADAEMEDDDGFSHMHTPISRIVAAQPKNPRARKPLRTTGVSSIGSVNNSRQKPKPKPKPKPRAPNKRNTKALGPDAMRMDRRA
ncbi:hypothetical protein SEPCBS57363_005816 [Sporothrix epigloea]|uniref:Uncharacterized protein n=1 Tax=Sporothrix epigloea TaxID=1892477 RepID=A0ABP0E2P9_9PEZI